MLVGLVAPDYRLAALAHELQMMSGKRGRSAREARTYRGRLVTVRIENRGDRARIGKVVGMVVATVAVGAAAARALRRITGVVTTVTGLLEGRVVLDDRHVEF